MIEPSAYTREKYILSLLSAIITVLTRLLHLLVTVLIMALDTLKA